MRVIGTDSQQLGIFQLPEALTMARTQGVDLVEIAPNATPPVCRLVDFGKYRYEQAKKDKESRKHQHANKVKEIQLSPTIDPHDFGVKLTHAIDFLCDEMKVKVTLRFRGREMAHQEFGFQQVQKFIVETAPYGHPDAPPKLIGKGINVMLSPLPRNKRAKNPRLNEEELEAQTLAHEEADRQRESGQHDDDEADDHGDHEEPAPKAGKPQQPTQQQPQQQQKNKKQNPQGGAGAGGFGNNPFNQINIKPGE